MPQLLRIGPYSIYFWSNEGDPLEPIHVHISEGRATSTATKLWITSTGKVILSNNNSVLSTENIFFSDISPSGYLWPTPGYTTINSYFGKRNSPTAGATSYHKGIDIGAPEGSKLLAICNGKITFTGFLGGRWLHYYTFC